MYNMYQTAYDLINQYIFGNTAVVGNYMDLMCVVGATACCAFLVTIPFVVVKWVMKALCSTFER